MAVLSSGENVHQGNRNTEVKEISMRFSSATSQLNGFGQVVLTSQASVFRANMQFISKVVTPFPCSPLLPTSFSHCPPSVWVGCWLLSKDWARDYHDHQRFLHKQPCSFLHSSLKASLVGKKQIQITTWQKSRCPVDNRICQAHSSHCQQHPEEVT